MSQLKNSSFSKRAKKEAKEFFIIFAIVMVIRTFFYQPFSIPSGSMIPTLLVGDFIFGNKIVYGYSNETFPFRFKILSQRLFHKDPKRGDIVIFNNPKHEHLDYIKRLVGLPGDKIQVIKGILHINGKAVELKRIEDYHTFDDENRLLVAPQYLETLPGGVVHKIIKIHPLGEGHYDDTEEFTVPADHFFMMGDNRDNSIDSREQSRVGFIHKDLVMGRADLIFFSTSAKWYQVIDWFTGVRPTRSFTKLWN
jgi:signal peptidase I